MILVDEPKWEFRGKLYCHMISDLASREAALNELHTFAQAMGLKRSWFQNHPHHPHYDISERKRATAVQMGARHVTSRELVFRNPPGCHAWRGATHFCRVCTWYGPNTMPSRPDFGEPEGQLLCPMCYRPDVGEIVHAEDCEFVYAEVNR